MKKEICHTNQLLDNAINVNLYDDLLKQINKDLMLANLKMAISLDCSPKELIVALDNLVEHLINNDFDSFLNLLYRIDLSEDKIIQLSKNNEEIYISSISFLILKREWKKVWFRRSYSS
ncbi:hypothetical protein OAX11_01840 [Flavobacteriaceae bacterium]|nr:hypothetical protein [Flavobacteriaceae bacterium]